MLGKTNELLDIHSLKVMEYSLEFLKRYDSLDEKHKTILEISSLLHDIGKCTDEFQRFLKDEDSQRKFTHNEISWAFVSKHLKIGDFEYNMILDLIYWHHGFPYFKKYGDKKITNQDIYDSITEKDIESMKKYFLMFPITKKYFVDDNERREINPPLFYEFLDLKTKSVEKTLLRSILITSDRLVSSFDGNYPNSEEFIKKLLEKEVIENYTSPFNNERFELQKEIVKQLTGTNFVNAPAGFGKTLIGFLKNLQSNKKMIWVCPRNIVAEQVYRELKDLIGNFGVNVKIELFYQSEVKVSNWNECKGFDSDIIVTNIDNFLSPSVNSGRMNELYFINDCDVVFDEYHELITEGALFSCFVNLMNIRHRYSNSDTILLSATPFDISYMWDTPSNKSYFLPGKNEHYPPAHNKKYKLNFSEKSDVSLFNLEENGNNLIILNSIKNAQKVYRNLNKKILIHSDYLEEDRKKRTDLIYSLYDKYSQEGLKEDVVSSLILQASMDISFKNLYESVLSPQTTIQRIGRTNRWGKFDESSLNIINFNKDKAERAVKHIHYTFDLSTKWFNFFKEKGNNKNLTLSEIYSIFNKFNETNKEEIKNFIKEKFITSCELLSEIYPIKFFNKGNKKLILKMQNQIN